jgi:hypothetical protein
LSAVYFGCLYVLFVLVVCLFVCLLVCLIVWFLFVVCIAHSSVVFGFLLCFDFFFVLFSRTHVERVEALPYSQTASNDGKDSYLLSPCKHTASSPDVQPCPVCYVQVAFAEKIFVA